MKESLKNKIVSDFRCWIAENRQGMTESEARKIADALGAIAVEAAYANSEGHAAAYADAVRELESHRRRFREHVDSMQRVSKALLDFFKKEGMVSLERDFKTNRTRLKPRSRVMVGILEYLNTLDGFVTEFYRDVYKIDEKNNPDRAQITLF